MRRRALLLVGAVSLVALPVAWADADTLNARSEVRRRYLLITGEGTLAGVPSGGVVTARIKRPGGTETALATSFTVGGGGALAVELRTTKRLLPDKYELEILHGTNPPPKANPIVVATFTVGDPAEVVSARSTLRAWLVNARSTLRDLVAALERSGAYHRNQLGVQVIATGGAPGRALVTAQSGAWKRALEAFEDRYRVARMDYGVYEREVLLSPFPDTTAALSNVFDAYKTRRKELEELVYDAAAGRMTPVPPATALLAIANVSAKELGLPADAADWGEGPLGTPEKSSAFAKGTFTSALGASFAVPSSYSVVDLAQSPFDRPDLRFTAKAPLRKLDTGFVESAILELFVRELPDMPTFPADIEALVEALTWEEYGNNSWMKMASSKSPGRQTLTGRWRVGNIPHHLVIVMVAPPSGKRLFELRAWCPEGDWERCKPELEQIAASFTLVGK